MSPSRTETTGPEKSVANACIPWRESVQTSKVKMLFRMNKRQFQMFTVDPSTFLLLTPPTIIDLDPGWKELASKPFFLQW